MTDQNFSYKRQQGSYNAFKGKTPKKRRKTPLGTGGTRAPMNDTGRPKAKLKNPPSTVLTGQTNNVEGNPRKGQTYAVGIGGDGRFYHEYGSGQKVYIKPTNPLYKRYASVEKAKNLKGRSVDRKKVRRYNRASY